MLRKHQLVTVHGKESKTSTGRNNHDSAAHHPTHTCEADLDDLHINSRSGLRGVLIFLVASAIALYYNERSLAGSIPASIMDLLGSTPPVILINCVFGASTTSSLILIAGRIYHDRKPGKTSTHLWFRVFFYLLYFISGALSEYFNVVFISGLVVLGLQHFNVWNYYMQAIEMKTEKGDNLKKLHPLL